MKYLLLSLLVLPFQLVALETSEKLPAVDPVSSSYLIKLTGGLLLVLVIVFFLAWMIKKFQLVPNSNTGLIKIISSIAVGQRERIALLQVGEEQILVGLCPGKIEKLHTLKNPIDAESQNDLAKSSFQQKFQQIMKKEKTDALS